MFIFYVVFLNQSEQIDWGVFFLESMLWGVYDEMGLIVIYNYFVFFNNCGDKKK